MEKTLAPTEDYITYFSDTVATDFILTTAEVNFPPEVILEIAEGHKNTKFWNGDHTNAVLQGIGSLQSLVFGFACKSKIFRSLCAQDRQVLIEKNGNLYIQYVVSRYLGAANGYDQLNALVGPTTPLEHSEALISSEPVDFDLLNFKGQFIPLENVDAIKEFKRCIQDVKDNFIFPCFYNGLLLHYLLFSTSGSHWTANELQEPSRIEMVQTVTDSVIQR